jgi:hypothetical protein
MPRLAKKQTDTRTILPPEEWDFRKLPEDTDLQTLIEYEYVRSSHLRQVIVDWHQQDFRETQYTNIFGSPRIQREAGFLKFDDDSPLGRICKYHDDPNSLSVEEALELDAAAMKQMKRLSRPHLSISEAIGRLFERIKNLRALEFALLQLGEELPPEIKEFHAERIALRFERFPEPWVRIQKHDPKYLQCRCASAPFETPAMWEVRSTAETFITGEDPFLRSDSFIIDASRSQPDILKSFTSWLNEWHAGGHAGRRIAVGWLQKLSAYRLARVWNLTFEEARKAIECLKNKEPGATLDALPTTPQSQRNWLRAVRWAKEELRGDFVSHIRWDFGRLTLKPPPN